MLRDFVSDLRLAARSLRRSPGFTVTAVLALAVGLGATIAMFSVMNLLLLRPLPYPGAGDLVRVHRTVGAQGGRGHRPWVVRDLEAQNTVFSELATFHTVASSLAQPGEPPEHLTVQVVSGAFFSLFRTPALLGRVLMPRDDRPGDDAVAVLSHGLWLQRFGGDPQILGRRVRIDGQTISVVGVMPAGFDDPMLWGRVDLWRPVGVRPAYGSDVRLFPQMNVVARLKTGETIDRAQLEMDRIAVALDRAYQTRSRLRVEPLAESATSQVSERLGWMTLALAGFVLLIVCINLAGVQLARLAAREHDQAIRVALGASRARLVRMVLAESLVLGATGGLLGLVVARQVLELFGARLVTAKDAVPVAVSIDGRVLGFAVALVLLVTLAVGLVPAVTSARDTVAGALRSGGRGTTGGRPRLRQVLVVAELVLALVLLAAGGLCVRGLQRFVDRDPGWRVDGLVFAHINLSSPRYASVEERARFMDELQRRVHALPGIEQGTLSGFLPMRSSTAAFMIDGEGEPRPEQARFRHVEFAGPGYFETFGIRLVEGRTFTAADRAGTQRVIVVNESMARSLWPGRSALGRTVSHASPRPAWMTVVGVVGDVRFASELSRPLTPFQTYEPISQRAPGYATITVRSVLPPAALMPSMRRLLAELDPELPLRDGTTARSLVDRDLATFAFTGWLLFCFAGLGMLVAALGVYGLFSGLVVQRTREIGVRVALGARAGQILWLVLGKGLRLAAVGAALGVMGAAVVARVLGAVAAEVPANDPALVLLLALVLVAVALLACWLPARRAARLDPMVALRQD